MTNAEGTPSFSALPGGEYQARQNDDGTWDVTGVPIFSTVPKGVKGAPKDIGETELREAVETHVRKFTDDRFLARLNVLHNHGIHKASGAGFFLPKTVASMRLGGEQRPVILADLVGISPEVFEMIERNELPYRSVEVREWEPLQFGALALLDTEPPFFEFPLMIGDQLAKTRGDACGHEIFRFNRDREPAVAAFVGSEGSAFLFRFSETDMPDDEKKDEAQMEDGGGELNVDAIVKAIEDGTITVKDFDAIRAAMDTAGGSGEAEEAVAEPPPENEAPVEFQEDEDLPAQEMKADEPKASFDAATEARIAGLEDRLSTIETENAVKARFAAGVETLEGKGFALSDSTKEKLLKAAGEGDKVFKLFTDTYEESALRDPPDTLTGQPADENYPEAVMAYFGHGPEETAAAIQMFREWSELPDDRHRSPLDKYLARNMKRREAV